MRADGRRLTGEERLRLYRQAAGALNRFYARWTASFCVRCLEVTRRHHAGDPGADAELVSGRFPGCCHAGVGEALWVPGEGDRGRFPPTLTRAMASARRCPPEAGVPEIYEVRERRSGRVARGVACRHLGGEGCRLGDLKAPLCLVYLCEAARSALAGVTGWTAVGGDTDDFAGSRATFLAVVAGEAREAGTAVADLRRRLAHLERRLEERSLGDGRDLWRLWREDR